MLPAVPPAVPPPSRRFVERARLKGPRRSLSIRPAADVVVLSRRFQRRRSSYATAGFGSLSGAVLSERLSAGAEPVDHHRVWPKILAALESPDAVRGADALERLRIECTTYATVSSLLFGASFSGFKEPPEYTEELRGTLLMEAYGLVAGAASLLQLLNVLLSTVLIIHTTQCTVRENTAVFMGMVDDLTYPNVACFYLGLLSAVVMIGLLGVSLYSPLVILPLCIGSFVICIRIKDDFVELATKLNSISAYSAAQHRPAPPSGVHTVHAVPCEPRQAGFARVLHASPAPSRSGSPRAGSRR